MRITKTYKFNEYQVQGLPAFLYSASQPDWGVQIHRTEYNPWLSIHTTGYASNANNCYLSGVEKHEVLPREGIRINRWSACNPQFSHTTIREGTSIVAFV